MAVDDTLKDFLVECFENLDQLDRDFVVLEGDPSRIERLGAIFRTIHTIKGNSGFLGFRKLEVLAHAGESLLSGLRDGVYPLSTERTSVLLEMVDRIREALRAIEETGAEGEPHDVLVKKLNLVREQAEGKAPVEVPPAAPTPAQEVASPAVAPPVSKKIPLTDNPPQVAATPVPVTPPATEPRAPDAAAPVDPEGSATSLADTNVRVDVSLLDKLMNLVGELVLSRNQILQFAARVEEAAGAAQRLNLITTELQEQVMKTRMQPIGNVWSKLPRVVRDLSITCGKQVRVAMVGKDTELDRTILEAIKDPLTHVVRNAVDHGIEAPEVRVARGKTRTGTLTLRAYHEGGQVNIEISDDGAGIDPDAVRRKAIERNIVTAERASGMSESEIIQLVFLPGFSTAQKISNVSGRGVGMDVVKTNIERIGGTVDLRGGVGRGTTLHIKIPLTLAIVPALVVDSAGQRYAIPQASLLELVRLDPAQVKQVIERIHGTPVYRLRGKLLPIVFLDEALRSPRAARTDSAPLYIVVLQANGRPFGLVVDDVHDTEEIVVKPLGKELKAISVFAGATIMGDGRVALILDVLGLAQHASVTASSRDALTQRQGAERAGTGITDEPQTLLLFDAGDDREMAVPLSAIARLEEFPANVVERMGRRRVVQYRGQIMPLVELDHALGQKRSTNDAPMQVIVYSERDRSIGFVVSRIIDVVEVAVRVDGSARQPGVLGAGIVNGKVVEFLDVAGLVKMHEAVTLGSAA